MLIIDYHTLNALKRKINDALYIVKALICSLFAPSLLEIEFEVLNAPFRTMVIVVLLGFFLDGYVCQMHHHVVHLRDIAAIFFVTKPGEAELAQPYLERLVARDKYIDSEIKLFAANQKRSVNVPANNIGFLHLLGLHW
jgi:ABC-type iron transport system FetAB permease component